MIPAALVGQSGDLLAKLIALPVFATAVALTVLTADALQRRGKPSTGPLLWAEAALLSAAAALPLVVGKPEQADDVPALAIGMTLVLAMGLQNALMRLDLASLPTTTVMTGNVTQGTIDLISLCRDDSMQHEAARDRLRRMAGPIAAFVLGAASGAGGYATLGFTSLLMPAAIFDLDLAGPHTFYDPDLALSSWTTAWPRMASIK